MKSVNKAILLGNVGNEPEIRTTGGGERVAKFSVATSYGKGDKEKTEWHRITAFGKLAEIVEQYVHKGDKIYVEGNISYSQTQDESGKPRYWTDIIARDVTLLGGGAGKTTSTAVGANARTPFDNDDDDDLGF